MNSFVESINEVLDSRQTDIAISKRNVFLAKTNIQRKYLLSSSVLQIYASLEGGIKELVGLLLAYINRSQIDVADLRSPFFKLAIENHCQFINPIKDLDKQLKLSEEIKRCILGKVRFPGSLDLESNITPKVIKKICLSLGISYFLTLENENDLNQLLRFRNNIAHGDRNIPLNLTRIEQFSNISQLILCEIALNIAYIFKNKSWLTNP